MSKTLEFVEQATIVNQRRLAQYKRDLESYEKDGGFINYGAKIFHLKNDITHIEEIVLPNLKQIKCELEAYDELKTPKKPRVEKVLWATNQTSADYIINHYCPNCNEPLNKFTHNYCNKCGCKIDWGGDDEE